jgi:DNA modification methylase
MADELADLIHADPPYGMGKEAEGIANDNLRNEKLDEFQRRWIHSAFQHARENCGLYVWGSAPNLWRLWYVGGLSAFDDLTFRNEIVWAKGSAGGGGASLIQNEAIRLYPQETERCLFVMRGQQFLGSQNADEYW